MDSILSNNSTDDHCREFVRLGGLDPLINVLGLPNLPLDFVTSPACQSVSGVCKSILVGIDFLSFFQLGWNKVRYNLAPGTTKVKLFLRCQLVLRCY